MNCVFISIVRQVFRKYAEIEFTLTKLGSKVGCIYLAYVSFPSAFFLFCLPRIQTCLLLLEGFAQSSSALANSAF